jgi:hypothetical protein
VDEVEMKAIRPNVEPDERRWATSSYLAAGFALFLFLYNLVSAVRSAELPTDGWMFTGSANDEQQHIEFTLHFLSEPTEIEAGDMLLAVNGQSTQQLAEAGHAFFRLEAPDWPDSTRLHYTLLRDGQTLNVEVPVRRVSFWQYFSLYKQVGISQWVQLFGGLFFLTVSLVVFLLRPGNRAAHALLFIGVTFGLIGMPGNMTVPTLLYPSPPVSIPFDGWTLGINPSLMYLVLAFPRPKLPLRKYPALSIALIYLSWPLAFNTAYLLNLDDRMGYVKVAFAIYPIQIAFLMVITIIALAHSAWKVRDPVGRSQFKWMLAGVSSFVFLGIGGWLVSAYIFPESMTEGNWLTTAIGWFLLPLCLAIAITRYRLFDIDVIIRRTLQYSLLTGLLSLVYFGGVALLQGILTADRGRLTAGEGAVSDPPSAVVIVITTLLIAALFNPLRRRVQDFIDRRFYRRKYDAEKALAEFAAAASRETDLGQLSNRLTTTVQDTLQPQHISLWLKPAATVLRSGSNPTGES